MVFVVGRFPEGARSVGILAGAFNPPTLAHQALIAAASRKVDQVVCVLPKEYPHKAIVGATIEERIAMLGRLGNAVALAERGLFIDIAREFRQDIAPLAELQFICGRDAAERIVTWDYGASVPPIAEQLREYKLLVCQREGVFEAPDELAFGIRTLDAAGSWDEVSSTRVREWLTRGDERWRELIPDAIADDVAQIYIR